MPHFARVVLSVLAAGISLPVLNAQPASLDAPAIVKELAKRCKEAKRYVWEGDVSVELQLGDLPLVKYTEGSVRIASGEWGRRYVSVRGEGSEPYITACNGEKQWSYVPSKKQYCEEDGGDLDVSEAGEFADLDIRDKTTLAGLIGRGLFNMLTALPDRPYAMDVHGTAELRYEKKRVKWPVIRLLSPRDETGGRSMVELTLDPATMTLGRFEWRGASYKNKQRMLIRITVNVGKFQMDEVPDSVFTFVPPEKAKRVDDLALPGQSTAVMLNKPAPDFDLPALSGDPVRLGDLKGKPVLLTFWATWCGPCRRELPVINLLHSRFKDSGLVVLGVNDEDKDAARKYWQKESFSFRLLHDKKSAVHRMFRVRSIPTVVLIDKEGTIAKVLRGSHSEEEFTVALKSVGIEAR